MNKQLAGTKTTRFCEPSFWQERVDKNGYQAGVQNLSPLWWSIVDEKQKSFISRFIKGKVLDIGCGYGRAIKLLGNVDYTGIDIAPVFLDKAREDYPDHKFILGDIRKTDFKDNEFDWGLAIGMSESIYWPEMKKEVKRVCKKTLIFWCEKPEEYKII